MATRIIVECKHCGQPFSVHPCRADKAKYCSPSCYRPPRPVKLCLICQSPVPKIRNADKRAVYCSRKCKGIGTSRNDGFHASPQDRFWSGLDQTPGHGPDGDCWLWTGVIDRDGYGRFSVKKKVVGVHVYSYSLHFGEVPKGLCVCHKCDIRNCANPSHLWLGDNVANTADMVAKGRHRQLYGEQSPNAKLTEQQVRDIRASNSSSSLLASIHGVSTGTISSLRSWKTWKHLTP